MAMLCNDRICVMTVGDHCNSAALREAGKGVAITALCGCFDSFEHILLLL